MANDSGLTNIVYVKAIIVAVYGLKMVVITLINYFICYIVDI